MQSFDQLVVSINTIHDSLRQSVAQAANRMLTMRNWLIGMYIVEYEQKGEDRAAYGDGLLERLSVRLLNNHIKGTSVAALRNCRQFYTVYPQLRSVITTAVGSIGAFQIQQQPPVEFCSHDKNQSVVSITPEPDKLVRHFSFTHFVELMRIADPLKRAFYEIEGINGCWSVPQLKRQMESQLYERTGLSKDKTGLVAQAHKQNIPATIDDLIRDPYILEFTGLPEHYQYSENDLETEAKKDVSRYKPMHAITYRARLLRVNQTEAEKLLWQRLRNSGIGYKIVRQKPLILDCFGKKQAFIADFYCHVARLVIEVDGAVHQDQIAYDSLRTLLLTQKGIQVLRFSNSNIMEDIEKVVASICNRIASSALRAPSPLAEKDLLPSPRVERGRG